MVIVLTFQIYQGIIDFLFVSLAAILKMMVRKKEEVNFGRLKFIKPIFKIFTHILGLITINLMCSR